ncbi:MAG: hypothetical protein IMZ55_13290, partial [Acidobacteria bacterium]|nr:hypothetical protein [Acidobacteriota bacterium]
MQNLPPPVSPVQLVLDQIFVAFGQGAGVMRIADAAIVYATQTYWAVVQANMTVWEEDAPHVREYARTLGHLAAHIALQKGRTIIEREDLAQAIGRRQLVLMKKKLNALAEADDEAPSEGDCPFCTV